MLEEPPNLTRLPRIPFHGTARNRINVPSAGVDLSFLSLPTLNEAHKPPATIGQPPSHFNKQALPSTAGRDAARPDARGMEARRRAYGEILTVCIEGAADRGPLDQKAKNVLNMPTKVVRGHQ